MSNELKEMQAQMQAMQKALEMMTQENAKLKEKAIDPAMETIEARSAKVASLKDDESDYMAGQITKAFEEYDYQLLEQICWSACGGLQRQHFYSRRRSDELYLDMNVERDRAGRTARNHPRNEAGGDVGPSDNYLRLEGYYDYHLKNAYSYEVAVNAFRKVWDDIQMHKMIEHEESGSTQPFVTNRSEPRSDLSEEAYSQYIVDNATAAQQRAIAASMEALQSANINRATAVITMRHNVETTDEDGMLNDLETVDQSGELNTTVTNATEEPPFK